MGLLSKLLSEPQVTDIQHQELAKSAKQILKSVETTPQDEGDPISTAAFQSAANNARQKVAEATDTRPAPDSKEARKEKKKENEWHDPNEQIKYVNEQGKVSCTFCSCLIGDIKVTSTEVKLQDALWATAGDRNGAANIQFKGVCNHSKWGRYKPPCSGVIQLGEWKNLSSTIIDSHPALLQKSTIPCNISGQDIKIEHSGQKAVLEELPDCFGADVQDNQEDNDLKISVYHAEKQIEENAIVFISEEPKMPEIRIKAEYDLDKIEQVWIRLKINYNNGYKRNNTDYFPDLVDNIACYYSVSNKATITISFEDKFRGGDAFVEVYVPEDRSNAEGTKKATNTKKLLKSIPLYIRGINPSKDLVKAYIKEKDYLAVYWFMYKIIVSETGNEDLSICQQFFEPKKIKKKVLSKVKKIVDGKEKEIKVEELQEIDIKKYGPSGMGKENAGIPYWKKEEGDGWGMAQIDWSANTKEPKTAPPQTIWNWKANIDALKEELDRKKKEQLSTFKSNIASLNKNKILAKDIVFPDDQTEGLITFIKAPTTLAGYEDINTWFGTKETNETTKSFIDADLIKRYNSGRYLNFDTAQNNWSLNRSNAQGFNYVERVSKIIE